MCAIILDSQAPEKLTHFCEKNKTIGALGIIIGPEGGWSPKEKELFQKKGCAPVSLGNRILRPETAGIAATAILLHTLG